MTATLALMTVSKVFSVACEESAAGPGESAAALGAAAGRSSAGCLGDSSTGTGT